MTEPIVRFRDFSGSPEPVTFRVRGDIFECLPEIPLDALVEMTKLTSADGDTGRMLSMVKEFFDGIMTPDSAARMRECMSKGADNPIGMAAIQDILPWLMEVYGLRPTQPSDESSDGSPTDDTSSTDGVSPEA